MAERGKSQIERVRQGIALHRTAKLAEAESIYREVLRSDPSQADALHFLGVLMHQRGHVEEARNLIERSTRIAPHYADAFNNLGNVLRSAGRFEEAEASYRRALALRGEDANTYSNLGAVLGTRGDLAAAEAACLKALELDPRHTGAYTNLGNVLKRQGRVDEAMAAYRAAIAYDPTHPEASKLLGLALLASDRIEEAREVYRQWLDRDPGNAVATHMLAACGGEQAPARAADGYVRGMFDQMADHFDEHLLSLNYRAPELTARVVTRRTGQGRGILRVLDAGCGTGLCGRFLRGYAAELVGVDLSPRMLARAAEQRLYDNLVESELVAYLQGRHRAFDLLVCADTLCYFGDLRALFAAVVGALIPGGLFVFTVERAPDRSDVRGYALARHGRYVHAECYAREALEGAGFDAIEIEPAHLRDEARMPVAGLVCSART